MNRGKAQLENRNSAKAIEAFAAATRLDAKSAPAWRNLARAQMLAGQDDEAFKQLERARALEKQSAATSYLTGLTYAHRSRFEEAIAHFEMAVRLDPDGAGLRFQLANAYQLARRPEEATAQFRETVRLDPLHATAYFKLAALAQQSGDRAGFERHQSEFNRLRKLFGDESRTPAALERCLYTQPEGPPRTSTRPSASPTVRFEDASRETFPSETTRAATAAAVVEMDQQGRYTVFAVDRTGQAGLLTMNNEGKFQRRAVGPSLAGRGEFTFCLAGDFHNDVPAGTKYDPELHARTDILLLGSNGCFLLKRAGPDSFQDVTAPAGLSGVKGGRGCWADYDHDGDVDLFVTGESGLALWQNNGDASFTNVTAQVGFGTVPEASDVVAVDFEANVATDLVVARASQPTRVFLNQRAGRFERMADPPGPWPAARLVVADDLENDGQPDPVLVVGEEALVFHGLKAGRNRFDLSGLEVQTVGLIDYDNDGWLDFVAGGRTRASPERGVLRLWRNLGPNRWADVSDATGLTGLALPPVRGLVAADLDNDNDSDLLLLTATGQLHFLRNQGGNANGQLKLRLVGTKTNPDGLGTRVECRAEEFWVTRTVSTLPIEIGLGNRKRLDSVLTVWGNGVLDNQLEVPRPGPPLRIVEKNVAAGSCPYLYAWDGRRYRFVTDLLGNSPLGLSLRRDVVLPVDPDELVWIGTCENLRPRRGQYELVVTEELREVLYLDQAKLIAVDHPPDTEVHSTDKLTPPPFPPSELWTLRSPKRPIRASGDDGMDRTDAVQEIDGEFAPPGVPLPPPLRGQCQPLGLTLDFGKVAWDRPWVLALTGWLQYGDASANIAASQQGAFPVIPPRLEAETGEGTWTLLEVTVGMPAGKTKTILCDLAGKVPAGIRRLRLTTTFEIRWDRITLFERSSPDEVEQHNLQPARAELRWRGFSEIKSRAAGHPQTPAYERASARPPWRTSLQGWCTRYGDVLDLVNARDERLALLNAGDALTLRFPARSLPPVPPDRQRTFFFYSVGWDKDADPNVVAGDTVEPLPVPSVGGWQFEFNTRWVAGDRFAR